MAKINRFTYIPFGGNVAGAPLGAEQFGSGATGTPVYTNTPATIMALTAWLLGWGAALASGSQTIPPYVPSWDAGTSYSKNAVVQTGGILYQSLIESNLNNAPASSPSDWQVITLPAAAKLPFLEDANAVDYVHGQALGYIYEMGIPEWDSGTTYWTNSYVQVSGLVYRSLIDSNLNNPPASSPSDWALSSSGNTWWGGNLGGESTSSQLNLTIAGFPPNAQIPTGTVVTCFVGVAFGSTITGGCTVAINGGTPIVISNYQDTAISASVTVTLARYFSLLYNGVAWILLYNPQNDGVLGATPSGTNNNYNPTGLSPAVTVMKLGGSGATITGLTTGLTQPNGWEILVVNVSSGNITLSNESGSSSSGNRFAVYNASDYVIPSGGFCKIRYSTFDQEWYVQP
jgi:hypothetical protein